MTKLSSFRDPVVRTELNTPSELRQGPATAWITAPYRLSVETKSLPAAHFFILFVFSLQLLVSFLIPLAAAPATEDDVVLRGASAFPCSWLGDLHARLQLRGRPQRPLHRQLPDPPLRHQRQPRRDAPLRRRRRRRRAREGVAARRRPDRRRAEAEEERASRCGRGERSGAVACSVRGASSSVVSGEVVRRHATDRVCVSEFRRAFERVVGVVCDFMFVLLLYYHY
ncbi:hypothetical protein EMIHUDRAFT_433188, partial [Emiliania huxleyi CCMP1516]|uniref:Uncharacterized protein n=2 Tax=Emiliania huxleyi TaxID=2903 RepID=A0A0D3I2C5_EMIH1